MSHDNPRNRLVHVALDPATLGLGSPDQQHERAIAIYDLIESNRFAIPERDEGPYTLTIGMVERKLLLAIQREDGGDIITHLLSLTPFGRIIRDYEMVCDSYFSAIRTSSPSQIEAIDMGRRGLHDEAAWILVERLEGKVRLNHDTARRLFTLIYALHWKG
jgi:uncharacterized protein (UPF0262 family)